MKLSVKNRLKVLMTGDVSDYVSRFLRGDDISEATVDAELAMKYSAVNSCVRVRAETFASVPFIIYKKEDNGESRKAVTDVVLYDIFQHQPNEEMAPFGFKEALMTNFDISGNVVCERLFNKHGELVGLYPYNHSMVNIKRNKETKKIEYKIGQGADQK
jgi:HK97 family phage portal protein